MDEKIGSFFNEVVLPSQDTEFDNTHDAPVTFLIETRMKVLHKYQNENVRRFWIHVGSLLYSQTSSYT